MSSIIQPPVNYTGSKYRLMGQLLEHLPQGCETFYDYFGGSGCVSINMSEYANKIVYNDRDKNLVKLMQSLYSQDPVELIKEVHSVIEQWGMGCGKKDEFHAFREYFNLDPFNKTSAEFITLIFHSFSSAIRYNVAGTKITSSSGGDQAFFRDSHEPRIIKVSNALKQPEMEFTALDLYNIDFDKPQPLDFVYIDPPYLASGKTMYSQFWGEEQEYYLLEKLDQLNERGVDFAVSNALFSKGKVNSILEEWAKQYNIIDLNISYKNSSHQVYEGKDLPTREVLITNY